MYKNLFLTAALFAACLQTHAQTLATEYKATGNGNPISGSVFCADPTALEYNGRLYVYGSNDHQEFIANGKKGENKYDKIKSIVIFSTDDMVNWTFHGTIDTKKLCATWVTNPWYQGFGVSWAPSVTWRTTEDGTEEFFLYFCNSSHGVGVLKANSPIGPWKSPLTKLLIHYDTPGANKIGTNANFDPGVAIDENGVGWLSFGGLGPSTIKPEAARIVKLKPSMIEVDGSAKTISAPYHFEANELNFINGKVVYTYCSNWAGRDDSEWNTYKAQTGTTASKPDMCTMCYMVGDDPTKPSTWVYKGVYGPHPGNGANNNHSHLQKFQGKYYYLYHNAALQEKMKSVNVIDGSTSVYRSLCVNSASVNESTGAISRVTTNLTGTEAIKNLDPYELQQAETMSTSAGINYEDFTNIKKNGRISTLGNDASENMQVKMAAGSWTMLRNVDFGSNGASKIMVRAMGQGTIEFRFGRKGASASATFNISSSTMTDCVVDVDPAVVKGKKTLYIVATSANNLQFDAWQATDSQASGVHTLQADKAVNSQRYDLSGRRLSDTRRHGVVIEQYTDEKGVKHSRKTY